MSITIGIYDFFSYTIPGMIYLVVAYATLNLFLPINVDLHEVSDAIIWGSIFLLVLLSFLVGHLFDFISHRLWYRLFYRSNSQARSYEKFTKITGVKASFNPHEWTVLLGVIRHNDLQLSDAIDRNKATSIMLRNISFALFLLRVILAVRVFISVDVWYVFVILAAITLIASAVSLRRSDDFNMGFYHMIYVQALMYGDSMEKILEANRSAVMRETIRKAGSPQRSSKSRKGG